jgi:hypothetical protein
VEAEAAEGSDVEAPARAAAEAGRSDESVEDTSAAAGAEEAARVSMMDASGAGAGTGIGQTGGLGTQPVDTTAAAPAASPTGNGSAAGRPAADSGEEAAAEAETSEKMLEVTLVPADDEVASAAAEAMMPAPTLTAAPAEPAISRPATAREAAEANVAAKAAEVAAAEAAAVRSWDEDERLCGPAHCPACYPVPWVGLILPRSLPGQGLISEAQTCQDAHDTRVVTCFRAFLV